MREAPKLKIVHPEPASDRGLPRQPKRPHFSATRVWKNLNSILISVEPKVGAIITEQREAIKKLGEQLLELREMLKTNQNR